MEHFPELRTALHRFLLLIIGFQRRQRTDRFMSYAKALKKAQCENVKTNDVSSLRGAYSGRTMSD